MPEALNITWKVAAIAIGGVLSAVAGYAAVELKEDVRDNTKQIRSGREDFIRLESKVDQIITLLENHN